MKILFDARHIKDIYSGLARYTHSILKALINSNSFDNLEIILDKNENYNLNPLFKDINQMINKNVKMNYIDAPLFKTKHHINVSKYVNSHNYNIYFYPHFDLPIFIRKKSIFVVHDLLPLVVDDYILKYKFFKQHYFKNIINFNINKKNTQCIAVSHSTKNDILTFISKKYENKIKVVYEAPFEEKLETKIKNLNVKDVIKSNYLFYIGDRRPHKNLKKMIDIFEILKNKYNYNGYFIIAGSEKNFDFNIDDYVKNKPYIKLIGKVSDEELILLYKNMESLFFLSKYEGFGLPIVEAAKYNKKIITSNNSSCKEIAPNNALLLNPVGDTEELAYKCFKYINKNIVIDNRKYLQQFSWRKSIEQIFKGI